MKEFLANSKTTIAATWVAGFVGTALLIGGFLALVGDGWRYFSINDGERMTTGEVIRVEPSNHQRVYFRYRVGEDLLTGFDDGFAMHVGDPVRVYYSLDTPRRASLRPGRTRLQSSLIPLALACAAVATLVVLRLARHRNRPGRPS